MLELINIKKSYFVGKIEIPALRGINLAFKENEFVAILGPSGCGKTTLLNIIGGLDRYTSGDLLIDGKSTKRFKEYEWDAYRNATIGFVFQNYNLINHLSVLDNVEMALRLSGVSPKERRERAIEVLNEVGLGDQLKKKPNQLSGGQMQRVAIARALVNNPKILLADEPTGALDSKTSKQIMELIKRISKDRLVIMVTHNQEIAETYSDRIIRLLDGQVIEDTIPTVLTPNQPKTEVKLINRKTSMSYFTALKTSFQNLLMKKWRTIITSLAGSIGIIGIALVLSLSSGMKKYVDKMQSDTLAGFPLMIDSVVYNYESYQLDLDRFKEFPDTKEIYPYDRQTSPIFHYNNINDTFLEYLAGLNKDWYNSISYQRALKINVIIKTANGGYLKVNSNSSYFNEIPDNQTFIESQYEKLDGNYPTEYNQVALIVDKRNRLDSQFLRNFGFDEKEVYSFSDFLGKKFRVILNDDYYVKIGNQYVENTNLEEMYNNSAIELEIVGIYRIKQDATSEILSSGIGYTTKLTDYVLEDAQNSQIVLEQKNNPDRDVLTGQPILNEQKYQEIMRNLGGDATPTGIQIYPVSFEAKDSIKAYLDKYNVNKPKDEQIIYTDLAEMVSNAIALLINTITIILSAFAGISLVVSSIMIGIITFVSVIERTKEIGIMRSLGARKKDISRIFNAETIIIGFIAGVLGIVIAVILNFPINIIIKVLTDAEGFAQLPIISGLLLILLSTTLTLIAGLIPSRIAANKDPVIALRTE